MRWIFVFVHALTAVLASDCVGNLKRSPNGNCSSSSLHLDELIARKHWTHSCFDFGKSLEELERYSQVIFTGTVEKLSTSANEVDTLTATVRVRRVLKGAQYLTDAKTNYFVDRINVTGLYDSAICDSRAREKDTKIFLANRNYDGSCRINSSLLAMNLHNLDAVEATVKGKKYRIRLPFKKEPCERQMCLHGAICKVNLSSNQPFCHCPDKCDTSYAPVCGSDNVTYSNDCLLRRGACLAQKRIKIRTRLPCDSKDPCKGVTCHFGASCVVSTDGKSARCKCPDRCYHYGDSRGSRPVCGDDGHDYESLCHLSKESCRLNKAIRIKYTGLCDPCASVVCPESTICKLNQQREPVCRCSEQCPLDLKPVCASDGNTYRNLCIMMVQSCKLKFELRVFADGSCEKINNPCKNLKCDYGQHCYIDSYNQSSCQCLHTCEPVMRPVCGKDATTYDNECELLRTACKKKERNSVDHRGACGTGVCSNYICPKGAVCIVRSNQPFCQCPACSDEMDAVCGSNGITYGNECKLRQEACQLEKDIYVKYRGICDGCISKTCDHYSVCVSDGRGSGECKCPVIEECPKVIEPVCGTDGITYDNECHFKVSTCKKRMFVMVASKGQCDSCRSVHCPWGSRCEDGRCVCPTVCPRPNSEESVCGSDGFLYQSECYMQRAACAKGMKVKIVARDRCPDEISQWESNEPIVNLLCNAETCRYAGLCVDNDGDGRLDCICMFECDQLEFKPVCGSDGRMYNNACLMDKRSCQLQKPIYAEQLSFCDGSKKSDEDCKHFEYGCCRDGRTAAVGPNSMGCGFESDCNCNRIGSYTDNCDARGQCPCRPGVSGPKCDHCMSGFWGIQLIPKGNVGCIPCGCSEFGTSRPDCEQTHGRCVCNSNVFGLKCNLCAPNFSLRAAGCIADGSFIKSPKYCNETNCKFDAKCQMIDHKPQCVCPDHCSRVPTVFTGAVAAMKVCGSDGNTYGSACQLQNYACRMQQDIVPVALEECKSASETYLDLSGTTKPLKTTRHLGPESDIETEDGVLEKVIDFDSNEVTIQPLSSTVSSTGYLNTLCEQDSDCRVRNSKCIFQSGRMSCLCKHGFTLSDDKTSCLELSTDERETNLLVNPCNEKPCLNGGTCAIEPNELHGYKCNCPRGFNGAKCDAKSEKVHLYTVPKFSGDSYIQFTPMDAYSSVIIEMELQPSQPDGLILYNAQKEDDRGDFLSLALINGHVEFRYDLGDGHVILRSERELIMDRYYKIVASRTGLTGSLCIDNDLPVVTPTTLKGENKNLNLNGPMFLGSVPKKHPSVAQSVGTKRNFVGCIKSLKVNSKIFDLRERISADIVKSKLITECEINPCSSMPCLNGGSCEKSTEIDYRCSCKDGYSGAFCEVTLDACKSYPCYYGSTCRANGGTSFVCICPLGKTGELCDKVVRRRNYLRRHVRSAIVVDNPLGEDIVTPEFHGQSFLELRQLPSEVEKTLFIEVWLKPYEADGLILFSGFVNELYGYKGGDFVSLSLVNGKVQFSFDLGSGASNITSLKPLNSRTWYTIKASRYLRNGSLQIDHQPAIFGESPTPWDKLNLDSYPLYVGGLRNNKLLPSATGVSRGFIGAIQRLVINGQVIDNLTKAAVLSSAVGSYKGPPCTPNPCKNGGTCLPKLDRFECQCSTKYTGKVCDKEVANVAENDFNNPLYFDGQTKLKYRNRISTSVFGRAESSYNIKFKTNATDGLLLWENKGLTLKEDYLAIAVAGGRIAVSFNLGKEQHLLEIRSVQSISDNSWHTVRTWRNKRQAYLAVDDADPVTAVSNPGATELNSDGFLWLGGTSKLPSGLPKSYSMGFIGCIGQVKVDKQQLHLTRDCLTPQKVFTFCV